MTDIAEVRFAPSKRGHVVAIDLNFDTIVNFFQCARRFRVRTRDEFDWVVEREIVNEFARWNAFLDLVDKHVSRVGQRRAFVGVDVIELRVALELLALGIDTPLDVYLDVLELNARQRKSERGRFAEEEAQWEKVRTRRGTRVWTERRSRRVPGEHVHRHGFRPLAVLSIDDFSTDS